MKDNLDAVKSIIDSIHSYVWFVIISIFALTCSWMVTIYIVSPAFYKPLPTLVYLLVGFTFGLAWYSVILTVIFIAAHASDAAKKKSTGDPMSDLEIKIMLAFSLIGGLILLGMATFLWYVFGWQFRWLVFFLFVPSFYYILTEDTNTNNK